jgi:hypothetical protein
MLGFNTSDILDVKNQYTINVSKLFELTKERGFLPTDILLSCYSPVPDSTRLDSIAYLNLSEMVRYRKIIESHTIAVLGRVRCILKPEILTSKRLAVPH